MLWKLSRVEDRRSSAMASLAYPIAKAHPPSGVTSLMTMSR
jgi:hypothetical protein